jgi:hypothetical protein
MDAMGRNARSRVPTKQQWRVLREVARKHRAFGIAQRLADQAREARNDAVHLAIDSGCSHAQIAAATGLGRARVGQIALMDRDR